MFDNDELQNNFYKFLEIYKNRPINQNISGIRIEHAFALFSILKKIKPLNVIESGVYKGMSTWIIERALPDAKIFCIEPNLNKIEYFSKNAKYFKKDITLINWNNLEKKETLVFFDDHVCFSKRIDFLKKNNFRHITFDDNLPSSAIGYITPRSIVSETYVNPKKKINYIYILKLIKYLIRYYFVESQNYQKIIFKKKFVEFNLKNYNKSIISKCNSFKKNIRNYYEFPPLVKFDGKKRFSKHIKKYDLNCKEILGNVACPIFDFNIKELDVYKKELGIQYGNFCYLELSQ